MIARNRMIIEAKWDKEMLKGSVPEVTSQAIALSEVTCVFNIFAFNITDYCVSSNKTVRHWKQVDFSGVQWR